MGSALVGACSPAFNPGAVEPLSESEEIERLERQTEPLHAAIEIDPWEGLQIYVYGGIEQAQAKYFDVLGLWKSRFRHLNL